MGEQNFSTPEQLARVVHESVEAQTGNGYHCPFDDLSDSRKELYERIGGAVAARVIREQVDPLKEQLKKLKESK